MKLPNAELAIVEIEKLRDYCLSSQHPRGRHKARVFYAVLGMTAAHAAELRTVLLNAAFKETASIGLADQYGTRYTIDFELRRGERIAKVRSTWIIRGNEVLPRFVTCYIL